MENDTSKCAHDICVCARREGSEYCSDHCKDAVDQDLIEIKCDCPCPGC